MKKLLLLLSIIGLIASSCEEFNELINPSENSNSDNKTEQPDDDGNDIIANNTILYTNFSTTVPTWPSDAKAFGVNMLSNTYDAENECWVITFDGDVTIIGDHAFSYRNNLLSIILPESVTTIEECAFYGCNNLTSVTIGGLVTSIGDRAFSDCRALTAFYSKFSSEDNCCLIIDGVLTAFAPSGLSEYNIPNNVTSIRDYAFNGCSSLKSITIPESVTSIGEWTFGSCTSLTSVTIPESVMYIGERVFQGCSSLKSITLPEGITSIGLAAFLGCTDLISITIPESATSIGAWAFEDCINLTSIIIPESVTSIGEGAFINCSRLKSVYCKPTTPPAGGLYMFSYHINNEIVHLGCDICVPVESLDVYRTTEYWSDYVDRLYGYDFVNNIPDYDSIIRPKVYVDITAAGWESCNAWAWNLEDTSINYTPDADGIAMWPGIALSTEEVDGKVYYVWTAPYAWLDGETIGFIVNDSFELGEQTVDLIVTLDINEPVFVVLTKESDNGYWLATINGIEGYDF